MNSVSMKWSFLVPVLLLGFGSAVSFDPLAPPPPPPPVITPRPPVSTPSNVSEGPLSGMEFVTIPAGEFRMGSMPTEEGRDDDEKRHTVTVRSFQLMTTEVTQAMWQEVMGNNPSRFVSPNRPVENVSWDDCHLFIDELNQLYPGRSYRLPTEAEWEYACRAGTTTPIYSGAMTILGLRNCPELNAIAWYGGNSGVTDISNGFDSSEWEEKQYQHTRAGTHPVGLKAPNAWGLYDMLGNVWEWCQDVYTSNYDNCPTNGSAYTGSGSRRVLRGGSWINSARRCRSAYRYDYSPDVRSSDLGFRLARSVL